MSAQTFLAETVFLFNFSLGAALDFLAKVALLLWETAAQRSYNKRFYNKRFKIRLRIGQLALLFFVSCVLKISVA